MPFYGIKYISFCVLIIGLIMVNFILNIFKGDYKSQETIKEEYYSEKITKALEYQKQEQFQKALTLYKELYTKLKQDNYQEKLALVLNNMIVVKKELNHKAKELFDELLELRFSLVMQYEEYYTIDYIYTLLMGVEWFNLPKKKLTQAEGLLGIYKEFKLYYPTLEKINKLKEIA